MCVDEQRLISHQKNMGLKHWIFPKNHFKTHLFLSIFGWGTPLSMDPGPFGGCLKPLKLSREAIW